MSIKSQNNEIKSNATINKDQWVSLFRETGLDDATMHLWHTRFEVKHPQAHQSFLEWLALPDAEIKRIRSA